MADITRRTAKRAADHLLDGEVVEAAVLCEPKSTYGPGMMAVALLPRTMSKRIEARAAAANEAEGGMAASFPGSSSVVAVTGERVLVMASNGVAFQPPSLVLERGDVAVGSITRKGLGKSVQLVFSDGSVVAVEAQRGQPFDRFTELLATVRS